MEKEVKELKKYSDEKTKKEARVQNDSNLNKKNLQELPNEVLLHIFDYLKIQDLLNMAQVSTRCKIIAQDKFSKLQYREPKRRK